MAFLAPLFALAALAAAPIVLLYLLKMKRQRRLVPSTLLWQETIKDLEANVPFQRLRANLLLILQILILLLLVLALMRPTLPSNYRLSDRSVLVVDVSGSMLATDGGDESRFERALEVAGNLIDSLQEGQRMMILAGGRMVTDGFVEQKSRLHNALDDIEALETESDCADGLQLAHTALAVGQAGEVAGEKGREKPGEGDLEKAPAGLQGRIYLISDGAGLSLPTDLEDLADYLTYLTVGSSGENAGIIGLQFGRPSGSGDRGQLFVNVANFGEGERTMLVSLFPRGEVSPIDARDLSLAGGQSSGVTFDREFPPGDYEVSIDGSDALVLDDRARLVLGPNRPLRVLLVSEGSAPMHRFLEAANCEASRVAPGDYDPSDETVDLYFFDGFVPGIVPRGRTAVFLAPEKGFGAFKPLGVLEYPRILDWKRGDPVMRLVSFADVRLAPQSALAFEPSARVTPLVWSQDTTLIGYEELSAYRHYCIGWRLEMSTWPRTVGFVLFMGNIIEEARRVQQLGQALVAKTGELWRFTSVKPGETITVRRPDGETCEVTVGDDDVTADFSETHKVGFYEATTSAGPAAFALNLSSVRESKLAPLAELKGAGGETIEGLSGLASGTEEIWFWAALAALGVLLLEWWVYHRRIG